MASEAIYDIERIKEVLPHRYPFLLLDKVIEFEDGAQVVGIKNVTANEPYFVGHFPGRMVMPGALILEAMAQTGGILAMESTDGVQPGYYIMLTGAEDFKFKRQVVPGDTLVIKMESIKRRRPLWKMQGTATVNGELVASGVITAAEAA